MLQASVGRLHSRCESGALLRFNLAQRGDVVPGPGRLARVTIPGPLLHQPDALLEHISAHIGARDFATRPCALG